MLNELNAYYISKEEPTKGTLLALRKFILDFNPNITETWTHRMPMFRFNGKLLCYLWIDKATYTPYIGMYRGLELDHPKLILGKRNKMKIMYIDPEKDLPLHILKKIMGMAIKLYV